MTENALILAELRAILGPDRVSTDEAHRRLCSTDLYGAGALCRAVISPGDAASLARALRAISTAGMAIVPRGGGLTYVSGYTPPAEQSVIVDVAGLDRIIHIDETNMYITVEAGVTWKAIYEALTPLGLRLPFFGTFSGAGATVGGGLSNGAMFLGSARYGSAAQIVLSLDVALADGTLLRTGHGSVANATEPVFSNFGPDLTGLFVHDCGAFGIKTQATFRLIKAPSDLDYLSFVFPEVKGAVATLSAIGRADLAEEIYIVDPAQTRLSLQNRDLFADLSTLSRVITQEQGLLRGLKSGLQLVAGGRNFLDQDFYSVHLVCAGRNWASVAADIASCRQIAVEAGGREIPNSIPKVTRAVPFPNLAGVLGPQGDRWVALNCKVGHSQAMMLIDGAQAIFTRHRAPLEAAGVRVTFLMSAMSSHIFSYECVFRWFDSWLPLHKDAHPELHKFSEPAPNPDAREIIAQVRAEIVAYFFEIGAASTQIGRTYPYVEALSPPARGLAEGLKRLLDPTNALNPGALGLGTSR